MSFTDPQGTLTCSEGPYDNQSYQHQIGNCCLILLVLVYHFIFQSMWDSTVRTVTWLWAGISATDLSLLQNIHTSHVAHTFCYSICTTGPIPESGQCM